MAKTSMKVKQQRKQKFSSREYNRCRICGRPHAYLRKYGIWWELPFTRFSFGSGNGVKRKKMT